MIERSSKEQMDCKKLNNIQWWMDIYICFCVVRIASAQHTENTFIHPSSYTHLTPHICITCPESTELEKYAARSCPEPTTLSITDCPAYSFCSAVLYYQNKSYSRMLRLYFVAQHTTHVPSANIHPSYDFIEMQRTKIQRKKNIHKHLLMLFVY